MHSRIPSHGLTRSCHSCPGRVNGGKKDTQHAPSTKTERDYVNGWIKEKKATYAKISPKMVNPRDLAGNTKEEEEDEEEEAYFTKLV